MEISGYGNQARIHGSSRPTGVSHDEKSQVLLLLQYIRRKALQNITVSPYREQMSGIHLWVLGDKRRSTAPKERGYMARESLYKDELKFPRPPKRYRHVILASLAKSDSEYLVIAFTRSRALLQFCRSGVGKWTVLEYGERPWMIIDVVVFKGKIYVLIDHCKIGTFNLNSDPMMTFLNAKNVPASRDFYLHLVAPCEELYIARFHAAAGFIKMHRLDFEKMEREKVNLNGQILFLSDRKSCALSFPTPFMACFDKPLNQEFHLGYGHVLGGYTTRYVAGRLKEQLLATQMDVTGKPQIFLSPPPWYFPHLSCTVDCVDED